MKMRDRALHQAVADLAMRPLAEIEAVLAVLPDGQSRRITALLSELRGQPVSASFAHLSPWLVRRIEEGTSMTDHAARALAVCARAAVVHQNKSTPSRPPSLLGRLASMLRRTPA